MPPSPARSSISRSRRFSCAASRSRTDPEPGVGWFARRWSRDEDPAPWRCRGDIDIGLLDPRRLNRVPCSLREPAGHTARQSLRLAWRAGSDAAGFPNGRSDLSRCSPDRGRRLYVDGPGGVGDGVADADGVAKVQPFYAKQLNQGDWLVKFADSPPGSFKGTFARKSNSRVSGTLSAGTSSGVTKILMTLVMPR